MYLYTVDNAVTYTADDLVLFREAPFACWMERLTLENPDHGVAPDPGSSPPRNSMMRQDDMAETLRAEGKDVLLVDWDAGESRRRAVTLQGMREGADFIVNGQLALGPLSSAANLLMRTSGYSELGDYLYIPCDTQGQTSTHAGFRLCFLADLLHSLQGQLPPQMLIIRGGDIVPLQTEDHIYHYRAVKHRFMQAMRDFRKHRMPDPAESSHFGRWSSCANEVLKLRAMKRAPAWQEQLETVAEEEAPPLQQRAAAGGAVVPLGGAQPRRVEVTRRALQSGAPPGAAVLSPGGQVPAGPTLAEQARLLAPVPTPAVGADAGSGTHAEWDERTTSLDATLDNLEFIGNRGRGHRVAEAGFNRQYAAPQRRALEDVFDRDSPAPMEPLPLPEVEEISLDGSVLGTGWDEEDAGDTPWRDAPPPVLKPAAAGSEPAQTPSESERRRDPSGQDPDEPGRRPAFSDTLITSDDYDD